MADIPSYGLDPSIVSYLQGGGATPMPDQVSAVDPAIMGSVARDIVTQPPPPPPPPPPTDHLTVVDPAGPIIRGIGAGVPTPPPPPPPPQKIGDGGATDETAASGLHPAILSSIQGGFNPLPIGATASQPDITPTGQRPADVVAGTINTPTDAQIAQGNAAVAKQQAFDNSPEGLAQKSDAMKQASLDEAQRANQEALKAQQAQNDATTAAQQAHMQRQAAQDKIDAAKNAEDQANVAKYTQQYAQQVKDAADYKVDTNRDVGLGGIIAIALSGVGNALDHYHGPNAAAQIIQNRIQQRIDDQWRQKQALGEKASGTKSVLDQFRGMADSDRQAQAFQTAAELQKTADAVKLAAAQSANPQAQANADSVHAALMAKSADIITGQAQRKAQADRDAQDQKQRAFANSLALRGANRADQQFDFEKQKWNDQVDLQKQALLAAGKDKQAKDLQAQQDAVMSGGLLLPTGKMTKSPDGTPLPEQKPAMQADGTPYVITDKDAARDVQKRWGATKDAVAAIDHITQLRQKLGGVDQLANYLTSTEDGRAIQQEVARAVADIHETLGINRFSPEIVELSGKMLTGGADASGVKEVLGALQSGRRDVIERFNNTLPNYTGKPIDIPNAYDASAPTESVQSVQRGVFEHTPTSEEYFNNPRGTEQQQLGLVDHLKNQAIGIPTAPGQATQANPPTKEQIRDAVKQLTYAGVHATSDAARNAAWDALKAIDDKYNPPNADGVRPVKPGEPMPWDQ